MLASGRDVTFPNLLKVTLTIANDTITLSVRSVKELDKIGKIGGLLFDGGTISCADSH